MSLVPGHEQTLVRFVASGHSVQVAHRIEAGPSRDSWLPLLTYGTRPFTCALAEPSRVVLQYVRLRSPMQRRTFLGAVGEAVAVSDWRACGPLATPKPLQRLEADLKKLIAEPLADAGRRRFRSPSCR
jgi:hypothetical protein